ncbi:DUF6249 domain-containing protein [Maricaulis sp.]|uniref:DUF6249 domain-containing protein n=1 Tax=Maricaulis sp. TaxID=1486257 RepID=UPI002602B70E|nr:DUF6249 domain-containing protein [Maricaulis sp.]
MGVEIIVPVSLFAMVVLIVFIAVNAGTQKRKATLLTVQEAIRSGQQMTPETIRALGMPRKDSNGDTKSGAILVAVALALIVFGWTISAMEFGDGDRETLMVFLGMSAFPGFIGLVLLGFGLLNKKKD